MGHFTNETANLDKVVAMLGADVAANPCRHAEGSTERHSRGPGCDESTSLSDVNSPHRTRSAQGARRTRPIPELFMERSDAWRATPASAPFLAMHAGALHAGGRGTPPAPCSGASGDSRRLGTRAPRAPTTRPSMAPQTEHEGGASPTTTSRVVDVLPRTQDAGDGGPQSAPARRGGTVAWRRLGRTAPRRDAAGGGGEMAASRGFTRCRTGTGESQ